MALTSDSTIAAFSQEAFARQLSFGVLANAVLYRGQMVAITSAGYLVNVTGTDAASSKIVGWLQENASDFTGINGNPSTLVGTIASVQQAPASWAYGSGGDALTIADVGNTVYAIDNCTVGRTSNGGARLPAGKLIGFDGGGFAIVEPPLYTSGVVGQGSPSSTAVARGPLLVFHQSFSDIGAGAQDAILYATGALPGKLRIVDIIVQISNAGAATGNATLRDTAAGAGNALSSAISTEATGTGRDDNTASATAAATAGLYLHFTDGTVIGEVWVYAVAEQ